MDLNILLSYLMYIDIGFPVYDYNINHIYAINCNSQLKYCNRVYATGPVNSDDINQLRNFYGTIPFVWFVHEKDISLCTTLENNNFVSQISFPAMNIDLELIQPVKYADYIRIEKVFPPYLETWIEIACDPYKHDPKEMKKFVDYLIKRAGSEKIHFYVGYFNDKPVATSMLIDHHHGIGGLHYVGTLATYRSQGFGYAMSHKSLMDAKERGMSQAILFASTMGKSIYEKIGFSEYALYKVYE